MREASSVVLAARLAAEGAEVAGYDPVVSDAQAAALLPRGIQLAESALEAARGADAVVIVTEWPQFVAPFADGSLLAAMRTPLVIDGRNQLDPAAVRAAGFAYEGVGRGQ
jgi:UDPglucose 6-dehydrogenase